ncbi:PREDICTED: rho GTPase-activating protein 6 isoform X2 [Tarenaya hassleriana]|uniref:rho GTPase-activating protein 6 isoform X2 n=1 Tax=Tarenaya hassleriana TaxID=28532 RepID=UPI00053C858C|nr:PREDICTED: rho GTPase-activating protein 6 isoform X2 [Tarenaya hassleriana]
MEVSLAALERPRLGASNTVFKSGPLFISSKGLGWKSWKKRWFILTRTSLVFFKNDPSALPPKGGEVNLTLGGIDLNSSGSVVVREDKKLLTVLFPDGRDGRAFTLKAETLEDLYEWKTALEQTLAQAPNAALVMGHNGIFRTETNNSIEGSFNQWRDKRPVKSLVVGRPILLALEDIDGSPSFLEKALQFLEQYGIKVEGILRQSADVEEVEQRVQEYEQGKTEFSPDEDPHVVGDCVKHVLRELPSSPVPASCCTALLEAYKIDHKEARVNSLHSAIVETFPEPNRRLLQRILKMMHTIASHSCENRMTSSAVAACMAPLLLRPLLAGECDLEDDFDINGDNSAQLLAAANAANNAQAIVTALLEDYENIFNDEHLQRCSISADSHIGNSGPENSSDEEDIEVKDSGFHNLGDGVGRETDDDNEVVLSRKLNASNDYAGSDLYDYKGFGIEDSDVESPRDIHCSIESSDKKQNEEQIRDIEISSVSPIKNCHQPRREILPSFNPGTPLTAGYTSSTETSASKITGSTIVNGKRSTFWGRGNGKQAPANGSFDSSGEDELVIQKLEIMKNELRQRIAKEARGNAILQASLERRKQALHERRLALEQDVARLQEQLQAERDLRSALEVGLNMSYGQLSSHGVDSNTRVELEEIALAEADVARLKQKVAELHHQLNQKRHHHLGSLSETHGHHQYLQNHNAQLKLFQQDFDSTLAFVNHERKQRMEESILGVEWTNVKGLGFEGGNNTQPPYGQVPESTDLVSVSMDEFSPEISPSAQSASRAADITEYPRLHHHHPSAAASAALVELTTRLDFFKERRSQLMRQLQNLDLNYGSSSSQPFMHRPSSSPPWN